MSQLLNARQVRHQQEVEIDLGDDTHVRARREDMTTLLFDGRIPMPLVVAVQTMIELPNASPMERIQALGNETTSLLLLLREHACRVTLEPILVMQDDGNADHLPVDYLDLPKLLLIWQGTAVIPTVTTADAATFRPTGSHDDAPVAPVGDDVPSAPEPVDHVPSVELVSH